MIVLLSPSKTINPLQAQTSVAATQPEFLDQSVRLVKRINKLGRNLGKTLGVNETIADLNRQRFAQWTATPTHDQSVRAAWTYRGETYGGLAVGSLDDRTLAYAQDHLRIVSGLYGLLRPHDLIMPYRLEMSTRLTINSHTNLYSFWGDRLAQSVVDASPEFILNCASIEYSKAVVPHLPPHIPVITPTFLHDGKSKMVFAKFMRGTMARWAVEHTPSSANDITKFNEEGYTYDMQHSTPTHPVFTAPPNFTIKGRWSSL